MMTIRRPALASADALYEGVVDYLEIVAERDEMRFAAAIADEEEYYRRQAEWQEENEKEDLAFAFGSAAGMEFRRRELMEKERVSVGWSWRYFSGAPDFLVNLSF